MCSRRSLFGWLLAPFAFAVPAKADDLSERADRVIDNLLFHGMQLDIQGVSEYGRKAYISMKDAEALNDWWRQGAGKFFPRPMFSGQRLGMLDRFTLYVI